MGILFLPTNDGGGLIWLKGDFLLRIRMIKTLSKSISGYEIKLIAKRGLLIEKFDLRVYSDPNT